MHTDTAMCWVLYLSWTLFDTRQIRMCLLMWDHNHRAAQQVDAQPAPAEHVGICLPKYVHFTHQHGVKHHSVTFQVLLADHALIAAWPCSFASKCLGMVTLTRLVPFAGLENDLYERQISGYLPTAEVAFVDEIFKANSAILNALLTLLNERLFDNGSNRIEVPLLCLVRLSEYTSVLSSSMQSCLMFALKQTPGH